jgi:hypothetical protein
MLSVLKLASGFSCIYLLFSLVISALNECCLSFVEKRAEFVKEGLQQLVRDRGKLKLLGPRK